MPDRSAAPELRLTTKLLFGVGQAAEGIKNPAFTVFLLFFYSQVLGLSAALAGTALLLALVFDAVTDPLIGSLSDSLRSRWGRRHPFMYAAAVPMALTFSLVFNPPADLGASALFAWLLVWTVLARAAMTLYHVPHLALGAELTDDYDERTRVVAYRVFFSFVGTACFFALNGEVFFRPTAEFPDNGQLNPAAYPGMALFFGIAMMLLILASAVGTHARIPYLQRPHGRPEPFSPWRLAREMREALANRSFRVFFLAVLAFLISRGVADGLGLYMGTYFWTLETEHIFRIIVVGLAGIIFGTPVWALLARRVEKKLIFLAGCGLFDLITVIAPVLKILGHFPEPQHAIYLPLLYGLSFAAAFCAAGALVAPGSMLADVADEHELVSGRRQEGIFFGAISFSGKAAAGFGAWMAGLSLEAIRFPLQAEPGAVPGAAILKLGLIAGPGVFLLGAVGIWLASHYHLDRRRHAEIRSVLAARGGGTLI